MSSLDGSRPGSLPRLHVAPASVDTWGDLAAKFATDYGLEPDPWQRLVLDDWLAEAEGGSWASLTCGLSAPRQNGKNGILEIRELYGMVGLGERILHTAHELPAGQKAFVRLLHFFGVKVNDPKANFPELNALVTKIRFVNGQEAIFLSNGGSFEIRARTKKAGRSATVDVLICDEAQEMSDDDQEALLPTTSAAPLRNPQWIFTGTPPGPKVNGEVFSRIRAEALSASSTRLAWHEWSCESDVDLDSRDAWAQSNPGLGTRVLLPVLEGERAVYSDDGFARERLGMWSSAASGAVIGSDVWADRADEHSKPVACLALAVDVSPDRSVASVALAGQRADGQWHVELDEQKKGVGWIPAWVADRCGRNQIRAVVIDAMSQAASLIDELGKRKIKVTLTQTRDMAKACGMFYDGAHDGWLRHTDQTQLNSALSVARKRPLLGGDAWAWNRKNADSDITPLVACSLALWGAQASNVKKPARPPGAPSRRATVL